MQALAINIGANTTLPGFRGPIDANASFVYVPIPERKPTRFEVPTYADLTLPISIPEEHLDTPVHLDPSFATYPCCTTYTYGDEHAVKSSQISKLATGDRLYFYATLTTAAEQPPAWMPPRWGAYLIGHFTLDCDPVLGAHEHDLSATLREKYRENAHCKRQTLDARVLVSGDPNHSHLYDHAIPLSASNAGREAGTLITDYSRDSGAGPWWRRPIWFSDPDYVLERVSADNDAINT